MHLMTQPNGWSCSVTAFAMAISVPVQQLIELIGHDGSELIASDPDLPKHPRGFCQQELVRAIWECGYSATPIELMPRAQYRVNGGAILVPLRGDPFQEFSQHITSGCGVIDCNTTRVFAHSVAFKWGEIFDPTGSVYPYSQAELKSRGLYTHRLWRVEPRQ